MPIGLPNSLTTARGEEIILEERILDYLQILLGSSDSRSVFYENANEFAIGFLDMIPASLLRVIQAVDKHRIENFVKSNIVCDDLEDNQSFMESVMRSVLAKVKLVDEKFLEMNGVAKSIEAITAENAAELCILRDLQYNPIYDRNAVWSEILSFLSSADTGIIAELPPVAAMGEDEAKEGC